MKKNISIIALIFLLIDQILKILCIYFLKDTIVVIPNFIYLIYARNDGIAFSLLSGNRIFIILTSFILLFLIIYYIYDDYIKKNKKNIIYEILYGLLLGGVLGNLLDRIVYGFVIDYISINIFGYSFPIFNFADILITVSIVVILILHVFDSIKNKNSN